MTDKEKIRAKVKRRKDELHYMPFTDENLGKMNAYGYVLKIIDSLPEEPASENLGKSMTQEDKYIKENNLDEIDAFLFREFCIFGGACSAQMALEYSTARKVAEKLWKKEQPASKDLEGATLLAYPVKNKENKKGTGEYDSNLPRRKTFMEGGNWQKEHLWHDAQGDNLPAIDREVIAFQGRKVVIAHRPNPAGWDGKSLSTGEVEHYTPKTYDKGGWNMPDVRFWLDAPLP